MFTGSPRLWGRRVNQVEQVHRILRDAGAFWISAQQITEQTGITRVAARIHDLKESGVSIESKFVDRSKGKSYRIHAFARMADTQPEPEPFADALFEAQSTPTSHHRFEDAA